MDHHIHLDLDADDSLFPIDKGNDDWKEGEFNSIGDSLDVSYQKDLEFHELD